jgi:tryptophan synthase beta subunit
VNEGEVEERMDMASTSDTLPTLEDVAAAQRRIAGRVHRTPLSTLHSLNNLVEPPMSLYIKEEQRQKTGSFKARGALNRIATLSPEQCERGLVTVSAGNHAAAVAWAASIMAFVAWGGPAVASLFGLHGWWPLIVPAVLLVVFFRWLGARR